MNVLLEFMLILSPLLLTTSSTLIWEFSEYCIEFSNDKFKEGDFSLIICGNLGGILNNNEYLSIYSLLDGNSVSSLEPVPALS